MKQAPGFSPGAFGCLMLFSRQENACQCRRQAAREMWSQMWSRFATGQGQGKQSAIRFPPALLIHPADGEEIVAGTQFSNFHGHYIPASIK